MMTMKKSLKSMILYAGLTKDSFNSVESDLQKLNTYNLRVFSIITTIYLAALFVSSFHLAVSLLNRTVYLVDLILSIVILGLSYVKIFCNKKFISILVYLFLSMIFTFGIALSVTQPTQTATTFFVMIMAIPLMFYDKPYKIDILIIVFTIVFLLMSIYKKSFEARDTDVLNAICFGSLSCVLNTINLCVRTERVWFGRKMQLMAESDVLTNLKNRNCFEQNYETYVSKAKKSVACIFADVNGLHDLNNEEGHEAGDEMLKFIAQQIKNEFGSEDSFRVGGDEYVVLICDKDEDSIKKQIEKVCNIIEEKSYHISVGLAISPVANIDMEKLIKNADENMYEAKSQYYKTKGIDRRQR